MAKRPVVLINEEIYHVYNRSIGNTEFLIGKREITRATELFDYYRFPQKIRYSRYKQLDLEQRNLYFEQFRKNPPLVSILAFAFMSDHFHVLLKQLQENGIRIFISNFQNAMAKYTNLKNDRRGGLFISPFKAKLINSDNLLAHVSRYIHLNPVTAFMFEFNQLKTSPLTSFPFYLTRNNDSPVELVNNSILLEMFEGSRRYLDFVANQVDYQRKLALINKAVFAE